MIAIIDYGAGNLFSLCCSLRFIGQEAVVTGDPEVIRKSDKIILPGVGAFADAAQKLRESGLDRVVTGEANRGKPLLGVCLGMQLLYEKSYEFGEHAGLGLLPGAVLPIKPIVPEGFKIPHIGWNRLDFTGCKKSSLFRYINEGEHVYFVHSYHAQSSEDVTATTDYGASLTAAAERGNVFGTQFHPEKSGETGLNILRAFAGLTF